MVSTSVEQLMQHINDKSEVVILSYGMGVESTAILLKWLLEPDSCPCALDKLIVITSMVGEEWPDTGLDVEKYILPLLRERGIRFVQVARRGHLQKDGITVLDDSRFPQRCYLEGDYRLSQEQIGAGTVPQYAGEHRCAQKFKSFVIEEWLQANVRVPARHAFGYNSEELDRVEKSELQFKKLLEGGLRERIAFGFSTEEMDRVVKSQNYDTHLETDGFVHERTGFYPLVEWGWNRQDCIDYIQRQIGVIWKKSACVFCPFAHNKQNMAELTVRQQRFPAEVAAALVIEYISLCFNPRGMLYSSRALIDMVTQTGNTAALALFEDRLSSYQWSLYRVRRLYLKKRVTHRAVESLGVFNKQEGERVLKSDLCVKYSGRVDIHRNIVYLLLKDRVKGVYPAKEEFLVIAPFVVPDKARYGIPWFNRLWIDADFHQGDLFDQDAG